MMKRCSDFSWAWGWLGVLTLVNLPLAIEERSSLPWQSLEGEVAFRVVYANSTNMKKQFHNFLFFLRTVSKFWGKKLWQVMLPYSISIIMQLLKLRAKFTQLMIKFMKHIQNLLLRNATVKFPHLKKKFLMVQTIKVKKSSC